MKRIVTVLTIIVVLAIATGVVAAQQSNRNSNNVPPPWAYGFATSLDPSAPVVPSPLLPPRILLPAVRTGRHALNGYVPR